jgi:hypothetical protein
MSSCNPGDGIGVLYTCDFGTATVCTVPTSGEDGPLMGLSPQHSAESLCLLIDCFNAR